MSRKRDLREPTAPAPTIIYHKSGKQRTRAASEMTGAVMIGPARTLTIRKLVV
jgi:hypothetical protein